MPMDTKTSEFDGLLCREVLDVGSKSRRVGFVLKTDNGRTFSLEIEGLGPFETIPLSDFEGIRCIVYGRRSGSTILISSIATRPGGNVICFVGGSKCEHCERLLPVKNDGFCAHCGTPIRRLAHI